MKSEVLIWERRHEGKGGQVGGTCFTVAIWRPWLCVLPDILTAFSLLHVHILHIFWR